MKRLLLGFVLCASAASSAADGGSTNGVRNPFWPMGYEGERETISPGVRARPKKPMSNPVTFSHAPYGSVKRAPMTSMFFVELNATHTGHDAFSCFAA